MTTWSLPDRYRVDGRRSSIDPKAEFTSADAAAMAGWTYRQLDWLAIRIRWNPGSGRRRYWSLDQIRRLRIAGLLNEVNDRGISCLPDIAQTVLDGPEPPEEGWVVYHKGQVRYGASPAVALRHFDSGSVYHVCRIPQLLDPGAGT